MVAFRSNQDLFQAVHALAARLESSGHGEAARRIREGLGCLNGLTDGWAGFLEAVEGVERESGPALSAPDRDALAAIREAVRRAVYRR